MVITQPEVMVDTVLWPLDSLHLVAEDVQIKTHNGLPASELLSAFAGRGGWDLVTHRKFQLGLNNLMVFRKA